MTAPAFGVDVVDLRNPRTLGRHLDPRFLARVFAPGEREAIEAAAEPRQEAWRRWAAKEAAFKAVGIHVHPHAPPPFTHAAFETVRADPDRGAVRWRDHAFGVEFRTHPAGRWVAALAVLTRDGTEGDDVAREEGVAWTASDTEETSIRLGALDREALRARLGPEERAAARGFIHGLVRLAARTETAQRMGLAADRLQIVNAPGPAGRTPPLVHVDGRPSEKARVSLSHDGTHLAWATWVDDGEASRVGGRSTPVSAPIDSGQRAKGR